MTLHADALRLRLALGPKSGTQIATEIGLSQPTVTHALAAMEEEVIKTGQRKSTLYLLRDQSRGV
jgi:DNA-binding transcriptional ArsR family regulator